MASFSITSSFHTIRSKTTIQDFFKPTNHQTRPTFVACTTRLPIDPQTDKEKEGNEKKRNLMEVFVGVEKLGKGIQDFLSPKRKGDWKDLVLMSLSFAVYVYISQRIVCAYCQWMSMFKNHW